MPLREDEINWQCPICFDVYAGPAAGHKPGRIIKWISARGEIHDTGRDINVSHSLGCPHCVADAMERMLAEARARKAERDKRGHK